MNLHRLLLLGSVVAFLGAWIVAPALARNPNISGGIQYVVQGDRYKQKGDLSDANRVYRKAIVNFTKGLAKDPNDVEAWDYLGRAYGELDIADSSGWAFKIGIGKAAEREDKKKLLKRMKDNRQHYWADYFSAAIETFRQGEASGDDAVILEASLSATEKMDKAIQMIPEEPRSYCNMVVFLVRADETARAMETIEAGLSYAPEDSCLIGRRDRLTISMGEDAARSGDFAVAIATFEGVMAKDPEDTQTAQRLGELYFQQGTEFGKQADAAPDSTQAEKTAKRELADQEVEAYTGAAKYFGVFYQANSQDEDAIYNYALALVRANENQKAAETLHTALVDEPAVADYHSLIATAYDAMQLEDKATKHRLVTMVLRDGTIMENPAEFATDSAKKWGAKAEAGTYLEELGPPDEVRMQTRGDYEVEAWFWWTKMRSVTLVKGRKVSDLDFKQVASAGTPAESAASNP